MYLLVDVFFASCNPEMDNTKGDFATITRFDSHGNYKCRYSVWIDGECIYLIDSCGKYKIGDTLYLGKKHFR